MSKNGLTIYLAGAMSGITTNEAAKWRNLIKESIEKYSDSVNYKVNVLSPVDYYNFDEERYQSEAEIMNFDLSLVNESDLVIVNTKNLNESVGSIMEVYHAWEHKIPVIAYDQNGDYKITHPWLKCCFTRVETCILDMSEYIKDFYMR